MVICEVTNRETFPILILFAATCETLLYCDKSIYISGKYIPRNLAFKPGIGCPSSQEIGHR